ncbi:MAG TPA: YcaO-like family protein [Oligoflexus sp.]|uniref:YcaO-like family protein n=1 Tax=Oligoflexus sp. TaxID=1971216 RepID=UPI002D346A82|nr:YcaO-like family protein [Oligoflexus sp.]HYX36523.1 YcaO-like family protein [Oligoflexus sp.]
MNQPHRPFLSLLELLPEPWELIDTFQEACTISGVSFQMAGLTARRIQDQVTVTGSACDCESDPGNRAWFELLERISLVTARSLPPSTCWRLRPWSDTNAPRLATSQELFAGSPTPDLWTPAKSNGVAMGPTWTAAGQHALFELIERHLVLASWYGAIRPRPVMSEGPTHLLPLKKAWRVEHYDLGQFTCDGLTVHASGTFLWPQQAGPSVIYGFGAHSDPGAALEKSRNEALQRLCFLHDADEPDGSPIFRPTPDFHQDYFLQKEQQALLRRWLSGDHFEPRYAQALPMSGSAYGLDLTPHHSFPGRVVQVFIAGCLPLIFGRFQPPEFPDLPADRLIHPIM